VNYMHLYAILYVGVNRAYMGARRQRMMLFAGKRLLKHLRLVGLLDQEKARIGPGNHLDGQDP
jgi:hypothetical protein